MFDIKFIEVNILYPFHQHIRTLTCFTAYRMKHRWTAAVAIITNDSCSNSTPFGLHKINKYTTWLASSFKEYLIQSHDNSNNISTVHYTRIHSFCEWKVCIFQQNNVMYHSVKQTWSLDSDASCHSTTLLSASMATIFSWGQDIKKWGKCQFRPLAFFFIKNSIILSARNEKLAFTPGLLLLLIIAIMSLINYI